VYIVVVGLDERAGESVCISGVAARMPLERS
jgi:hypothetical protein